MDYPRKLEHGIMFHHFHNERHSVGQGSLSQEDFEEILNFIGIQRIVDPFEWLRRLEANKLSGEHVCLTFDDGLLCQFDIALPVLQRYDLKAFWFVYSSVFEGEVEMLEVYRRFRSQYFQDVDDFYELFFTKILDSEFSAKVRGALDPLLIKAQMETFPFYSLNDVKYR